MSATVSDNNTRLTFTISKELKSQIEDCAKKENRSVSNLINVILQEYVRKGKS